MNIVCIDSNQNACQERKHWSLQKNKPFKTAPKTSPGSAPRRHDSRLRMAALSKTKKQLFTEPRSSTQKACMFDAKNKTMSTTAVPPLVTCFCGSTKASFRDGSVLSAPAKNLVDLLTEGAAFGKSRLSAGGLAQNRRARTAHHNSLPKKQNRQKQERKKNTRERRQ